MVESLAARPLSKSIAARKSAPLKQNLLPVPEVQLSPRAGKVSSVSHYSLSPSRSVKSFHPDIENVAPGDDVSDQGELVMTDSATDLRARMEAELIALRRAQSIFAESHPSVDVHGKLQDLQEMYIGDLLVKDCQIAQLRSQMESARSTISTPVTTAAVPPPQTSMLAARVQSLQKSVSQERQRRMETEQRLEELLRTQESQTQISKTATAHRVEVHQLKSKIAQLQEANKRMQQRTVVSPPRSGDQTPAGGMSPASSAVGGTEKVAYVKYASLRAEKRQIEAKLTAQVEQLTAEKSQLLTEKQGEIDKLNEHHRRVVQDLERKTKIAQQSKTEEGKELGQLRAEKDRLEALNVEYKIRVDELLTDLSQKQAELDELIDSEKFLSLELEDREKLIADLELKTAGSNEVARLREERLDLLEKIEEREDMLKNLQDESAENRGKISQLSAKLALKEHEIAAMISQADELDSLLAKADQDVSSSRIKIQALTAELDALRAASGSSAQLSQLEAERDSLKQQLAKLDAALKATQVNADVMRKRYDSEVARLDQQRNATPKKDAALVEAETMIGQLEDELNHMRRAMQTDGEADETAEFSSGEICEGVTENVGKAEQLFHRAVDMCTDAEFDEAVALLQRAAVTLSNLPRSEITENDPDTLRILESDIYGQLGVAFQSLSRVQEAIEAYNTAVDVDPDAHACHANLAVLLQHQSRIKEAESHASLAARLAPEIDEYQQLLHSIRSGPNVTLSSPSSPARQLRHSTRW